MSFSKPPRIALPAVQVAPISPATLELMRRNLAARAEQHDVLGDDRGAQVYRRLAEEIR